MLLPVPLLTRLVDTQGRYRQVKDQSIMILEGDYPQQRWGHWQGTSKDDPRLCEGWDETTGRDRQTIGYSLHQRSTDID